MWHQLGLTGAPSSGWQTELRWGTLAEGTQTAPGDALFPRIDTPIAS
jgi:hypothetical protein